MDESQILVEALAAAWPDEPGRELITIGPDLIDALRELDGFELIRGIRELDERVQDEIEPRLLTVRGVEARRAVPELRRK